MDSYEHGVPSWVDLGVPDIGRAAEFYGGLFGWNVVSMEKLAELPAEIPSHWGVYSQSPTPTRLRGR